MGGGSAMDVAKCIKLYSNLPGDGKNGSWLDAEYIDNNIPKFVNEGRDYIENRIMIEEKE